MPSITWTNDPNEQQRCVVRGCGALTTSRAVLGETLIVAACQHHTAEELDQAAEPHAGGTD